MIKATDLTTRARFWLARWLAHWSEAVMGRPWSPMVCVHVDETLEGAIIERLLLESARRVEHGVVPAMVSCQSTRVIAAVVRAEDEASFVALGEALRSQIVEKRATMSDIKITPEMSKVIAAPILNIHAEWQRYARSEFRREWLTEWAGDDVHKQRVVADLLKEPESA